MVFALLLGIPLCGALALGLFGARRWAPELNVAVSLGTFLAACALTARVVSQGPLVVAREQFFIDPFNVFLVTLTALVGLTTSIFSRPYMRVEMDHGRVSAARLRQSLSISGRERSRFSSKSNGRGGLETPFGSNIPLSSLSWI